MFRIEVRCTTLTLAQIVQTSKQFGGGKYNASVAAEVRWNRIQDSIARNPEFVFGNPRLLTAIGEAAFPIVFFIDGRIEDDEERGAVGLDLEDMRGFFQHHRYPKGFFRRNGPFDLSTVGNQIGLLQSAHPIAPGFNNGTADNYVPDGNFLGSDTEVTCALYRKFVNITVELYPNPQEALRKALNGNLDNFYSNVADVPDCAPSRPYA